MKTLGVSPSYDRLSHYLFRYPAKFHPPVVRSLIERYTTREDFLLDPFCGSGTLLVEAAVLGRDSLGLDVDPVAVVVANAKTQRLEPSALKRSAALVLGRISPHRRPAERYEVLQFASLGESEYEAEASELSEWIPAIPNLRHWFRSYVIIDLAKIRRAIVEADIPETHRSYLLVVFASIVRNASNADPVPVSGLEVTKWMREREAAGRVVDPFGLFEKALAKALETAKSYRDATTSSIRASARLADATRLGEGRLPEITAVITSPPYHGAVDYYRRHQLEMFWLGLTTSQAERVSLLQRYIGRPHVPPRHEWVNELLTTAIAKEWDARIREISVPRANEFRHYLVAMTKFFGGLSRVLPSGAPAVLVVGHSVWNKTEIPTTDLFDEISGDDFRLDEVLSYEVKNRYMSYQRHNDANISREFVLVLRKSAEPARAS